jgi:hypothetical protein
VRGRDGRVREPGTYARSKGTRETQGLKRDPKTHFCREQVTDSAQKTHPRTHVRARLWPMDRVSLEQMLGRGLSLAEIGRRFGRHEATVSYWLKQYGLEAANHETHAARVASQKRSWRG